MPFEQCLPRTLSASTIRQHAPSQSGLYGISNAAEWIYIGETDNIQATLLQHLQEQNTPLLKRKPTGFVYEVCDRARRTGRQVQLIQEYGPRCNAHATDRQ